MAKTKELTVTSPSGIDFKDPKMIETLKRTVAHDLDDYEFKMFEELCVSSGLNPFKRQIWAIKTKAYTNRRGQLVPARVQIMAGINGFYEVANSYIEFDGVKKYYIYDQGKTKSVVPLEKPLYACVVAIYRKDRAHPHIGIAKHAEYFRDERIWNEKPTIMLLKCAFALAAREAFPSKLGGLYIPEEMPPEYNAPMDVTPEPDEPKKSRLAEAWEEAQKDKAKLEAQRIRDEAEAQMASAASLPQAQERERKAAPMKSSDFLPKQPPPPQKPPLKKRNAPPEKAFMPVNAPPKKNMDWSKFIYRYHIPFEKAGWDMNLVRQQLKQKGFLFRGTKNRDGTRNEDGDDHWYGDIWIPELEDYYRPLNAGNEQETIDYGPEDSELEDAPPVEKKAKTKENGEVSFEDDELPEWL